MVNCYEFLQAASMVNDHLVPCPRFAEVQALLESEGESR